MTALDDGECHLPPLFYPGADFTSEPELLSSDGTYHIRAGAYLIQGPGTTMLVDAGAGPDSIPFPAEMATAAGLDTHPEFLTEVGHLPSSLAAAGVDPSDVTVIVLTHLHSDHIGWIAPHGKVFFPNAVVYYGEADWDALISPTNTGDPDRVVMQAARDAGVLRPLTNPSVLVADGITAVHAPGHTPGSYIVIIASDGQQLYLTGDVIQHPQQLTRSGVDFLTDHDRAHATATRAELFAEVAGSDVILGTAHVPNPVFRRVTADQKWLRADSGRLVTFSPERRPRRPRAPSTSTRFDDSGLLHRGDSRRVNRLHHLCATTTDDGGPARRQLELPRPSTRHRDRHDAHCQGDRPRYGRWTTTSDR